MELVPIISFNTVTSKKIVENIVIPATAEEDILPTHIISIIS